MKTKNLICATISGVVLVGTANALTTEDIRQRCLSAGDLVWDAKNLVCINKNPCVYEESHCNRVFADIEVGCPEDGETVVRAYLDKHGYGVQSISNTGSATFGQDYVRVHLTDGGYLEFEFDDLDDTETQEGRLFFPLCVAFGGRLVDGPAYYGCQGITQQECYELAGGQANYVESQKVCDIRGVNFDLLVQ